MEPSSGEFVHTDCKPLNFMGSVWICNLKENRDCPYALKHGYLYYCNHRELRNGCGG